MTAMLTALLATTSMLMPGANAGEEETVGKRPYEMDWANRNQDDHPPLLDFEDLDGWKVETKQSEATFWRTREQQRWGKHVGKGQKSRTPKKYSNHLIVSRRRVGKNKGEK